MKKRKLGQHPIDGRGIAIVATARGHRICHGTRTYIRLPDGIAPEKITREHALAALAQHERVQTGTRRLGRDPRTGHGVAVHIGTFGATVASAGRMVSIPRDAAATLTLPVAIELLDTLAEEARP
jgi:topoisomerase IA-like protein